MVYRTSGNGGILLIETTLVPGGKGRLVLTGSLGDVIKESVELGLTWVSGRGPFVRCLVVPRTSELGVRELILQVKSIAVRLGITSSVEEDVLKGHDLHVSFEACFSPLSRAPCAPAANTASPCLLTSPRSHPASSPFRSSQERRAISRSRDGARHSGLVDGEERTCYVGCHWGDYIARCCVSGCVLLRHETSLLFRSAQTARPQC
jgi:hypothetical protein